MHLLEPLGSRSWPRVIKDLGGVQAQVASAGALQCQVRARGVTTETLDRAITEKRRIVKAWAMRGTLHWIAAEDFPTWAAALSIRPRWSRAQENFWKKEFGLTWKEVRRSIDVVYDVLNGQCLTRAELADRVYDKMRNTKIDERLRSGWGEITKVVALRGGLCFGPNEGRNVTFVRADQWVPGWKELDPEASLKEVLRRYLRSHGPATREEFARWWGFAAADARKVIGSILGELAPVDREGDHAYVLKKDVKALEEATEDDEVRMVGMFDAYTLSGLPHDEVVPKAKKSLVYRTGAWVWPVVMRGGVTVGVWNIGKRTRNLEVQLFKKGTVTKRSIQEAAEAVTSHIDRVGSLTFL